MAKHTNKEAIIAYNLKLPVSIHKKIVQVAIKERRSLSDQIIYFLEKALKSSAD